MEAEDFEREAAKTRARLGRKAQRKAHKKHATGDVDAAWHDPADALAADLAHLRGEVGCPPYVRGEACWRSSCLFFFLSFSKIQHRQRERETPRRAE